MIYVIIELWHFTKPYVNLSINRIHSEKIMNKLSLSEYFKAFRVNIALKVVLSGIICILINNIFHLKLGYFSLLFVLLTLVLFHGDVLKAGSLTIAGCIISGGVSLLITYLFFDSKLIYVLLMSVWIFLVVALLVKYFLAMLVSGVAATMVMYNSIYNSISYTTSLFEYYLVQLFLAMIVCYVIDELVWPNHSRRAFQITLSTVYNELSELFIGYTSDSKLAKKNHKSLSTKLITFSNLVTYVNRMSKEEKDKYFPIDEYLKIITFTRGIFIKTEVLEEFVLKEHLFIRDDRVLENVNQILAIISQSFCTISQSIGTNDIVELQDKELADSLSSLHEVYREMHEVEGREDEYYDDLHAFGAMLPVLDDITDKTRKIVESINIFHTDGYKDVMRSRLPHTHSVEKIRQKSFFNLDKQSYVAGMKTVVIFLILMFGEVVFGLPGGGQVVFFAILFGVIPNLGQAYMKSQYGIVGVCLGLLASFISLMILSISPHFLIVVLLYSLFTFVATYIASSSRDISVSGLQAGLLFPFGILLTTGPNLNIESALTRFLALFSAILIGLIIQHLLWPSNPYNMLKEKVSKSVRLSAQILNKLISLNKNEVDKVDKGVLQLAASLPTSTSLLHDAEYVIREEELHAEHFIEIVESIELIYADLETLNRTITGSNGRDLVHSYLNAINDEHLKICDLFDKVSYQFDTNQDFSDDISQLGEEMEKQVTKFRESGEWRQYTPEEIEKSVLVNTTMSSLLESLNNISIAISKVNEANAISRKVLVTKKA